MPLITSRRHALYQDAPLANNQLPEVAQAVKQQEYTGTLSVTDLDAEHARLVAAGWQLAADGCYRKVTVTDIEK